MRIKVQLISETAARMFSSLVPAPSQAVGSACLVDYPATMVNEVVATIAQFRAHTNDLSDWDKEQVL